MVSQIEQFEREAEETRSQLAGKLDELRERVTPGRVVDQLLDYAQNGAAGEFLRNLGREARENPMPIVLIGIGIAWLIVASSRTSREAIGSAADSVANAADSVAKKAADIGMATSAAVSRTSEWGRQRAAQISERTSRSAANGYRQNDPKATEQLYREIAPTFLEDKEMVEAQQRRLDEHGEQGLVDIASDANRMHMRRTVERLIAGEQSAVAAQ